MFDRLGTTLICNMYLNFTVICQPSFYVKVLIFLLFKSSKKDQTGRMNAAAKELRKLLMEDQSFNVSSIFTTLESGTEMIKKIIQALKNDSDPIQPCSASGKSPDSNLNYSRKCHIKNNCLNRNPFLQEWLCKYHVNKCANHASAFGRKQ